VRVALPWIFFGMAVVLATEPVWRLAAFGFNPTLDDLLQIVCFGPR
jgi:hypothetical protein